jgi:hypothetical protein
MTDVLRCPICPRCRGSVKIPLWRKLRARLGGMSKLPLDCRGQVPSTKPRSLSPRLSDGVVNTLRSLGGRAWNPREIVNGPFLFHPDILLIRDEAVLNQALQSLYLHARAWAPGLDIPYHVPQLTIGGEFGDETAGRFVVDHEGWTKIELSRDFLDVPRATWLILAHEVCHHILEQSSLANHQDQIANERQTDLLMFVCGYGELARKGYEVSRQFGSAYIRSHLGYLKPEEHEFAFEWVIAARVANRLGGMEEAMPRFAAIAADFVIEKAEVTAERLLNRRIPDAGTRKRLIAFYRNKHPYLDLSDLVDVIIDDYERDRR